MNQTPTRKHLFIIDPLAKLDFKLDSSLRMARSLITRGEAVYVCSVEDMRWNSAEGAAFAICYEASLGLNGDLIDLNSQSNATSLAHFDVIHMRKDPPFDQKYLSVTWMLDSAYEKNCKILILNSPSGLRTINEKLSILRYPQFCVPTLVSRNPLELAEFVWSQCGGDSVLKPLDLYGGKGVVRIQGESLEECKSKYETHLQSGDWMMAQKFNSDVFAGEVRAFVVNGKCIAWCLKKPMKGSFLANSNFGSTRHTYSPNEQEVKMVEFISRDLQKNFGIYVIGFDIIGGKLSEINVTSPRLLSAEQDQDPYFKVFADEVTKLIIYRE